MARPVVEVSGLSRTFTVRKETVSALRDVTFTLHEGEVVGLLGSNGAGKTTLTKILSALLLPTGGSARILGHDVVRHPRQVRERIGVIFGGETGLYDRLTGRENIRFFAMLNGVRRRQITERIAAALDEVGLTGAADRPVETYSKGMRQRLHIAIGTVHRPRVLLLDEPTIGLDPIEAERLRTAIGRLRDDGVSVLLTSHYLLDVERLADRVLVLADGTISANMTTGEFARAAGYRAVVTVRARGKVPPGLTDGGVGVLVDGIVEDDDVWSARLRVQDWGPTSFAHLSSVLSDADVLDVDVAPVRLEDVYATLDLGGRR
ncbi:ABC transporter ATP-binding protein [Micromonospora sp. NPDC050187]|uniref:ABC transporter ATP-binding protein n=1 Tax=Micromonospora sp. NPDC050187 TaxID=3364277 RepID=UPI0037BA7E9C